MRLKFITTFFLILGLSLLLLWPRIVGPHPGENASKQVLASYGIRMAWYFGACSIVFVLTALCALLLVRQMRREYLELTRQNLKELVEGTLKDHDPSS